VDYKSKRDINHESSAVMNNNTSKQIFFWSPIAPGILFAFMIVYTFATHGRLHPSAYAAMCAPMVLIGTVFFKPDSPGRTAQEIRRGPGRELSVERDKQTSNQEEI
jgi:hypothetical protein